MIARLALVAFLSSALVMPAAMTGADSAYAASSTKKKKSSGTSADGNRPPGLPQEIWRGQHGLSSRLYPQAGCLRAAGLLIPGSEATEVAGEAGSNNLGTDGAIELTRDSASKSFLP